MDLQLLDRLMEDADHSRLLEVVEYFSVDDACQSQDRLDRYIPGMDLQTVYHSPLVGIWKDGRLVECASGARGRKRVAQYFGIPTEGI